MKKIRFGPASGLAVLCALGLAALLASSAQAVELQIEGKPALLATVTGAQEGAGHLIVEGRKLDIECQKGDVNAGSEIINSKEGLAKITFLECKTYKFEGGKKGTEIPCTVANPVVTVVILVTVYKGIVYIKIESDGGALLTTIIISGALCPLPEENPIKGTALWNIPTNNSVVDLISTDKATQILEGDKLFFGAFESYIEAKATLELTGAHKGLKFGVA